MTNYYSNGKLLLTGEYLVLNGAHALAVPLNVGQNMQINYTDNNTANLEWCANDLDTCWFRTKILLHNFEIMFASNDTMAQYLVSCLKAARQLNPLFLYNSPSIEVKNYCNFNIQWGLGSSSTFISNLAWWANVNPFALHWLASNGSGYDVACARANSPILYRVENQVPEITEITFHPPFLQNLHLIYSGRKQNSAISVNSYKAGNRDNKEMVEKISSLTKEFVTAKTIDGFIQLMHRHETIISSVIGEKPVQDAYFKDFDGAIKSLGAWGGDFMLAATNHTGNYIANYFKNKGFSTIIPLSNLLHKPNYGQSI